MSGDTPTRDPSREGLSIALCVPAWPYGALPNGIVAYVEHIAPALRELGARVYVLAGELADDADPWARPVPLPRDPLARRVLDRIRDRLRPGSAMRRRTERAIAAAIDRLDREAGLDLVEIEESFGWCGEIARRVRVPVVARLHGPWFLNGPLAEDPTTPGFAERVAAEGRALASVPAVSAPARDVLEQTRSRYGLPLADAVVIPNPVAEVPPARRWRRERAKPETILFVGRFDAHKGGDVVIDAFARIRAARPDARLLFVGPDRGVADASGRRRSVGEWADERLTDPSDRAALEILGPLPPERVAALRLEAAMTIVASRYEIFGYTLTEAMAQGCPIVATAVGGLPEVVQDQRSGLLVAPDDPDALAAAAVRLLDDPALGERLGAGAIARAQELAPARIAAETLAFYRRTLEAGG